MPDPVKFPTIEQVCEKALRLPCSPALLPRLATALASDESSGQEIEGLISLDPSLAGATLRLANSAALARGKVDSLQEAVLRLGAKEIFRLAALVLVNRWESVQNLAGRWEPGDFSRQSLITAIAAEVLAERLGRVSPQTAYSAGLVCDLGRLAIAHGCPSSYGAIREHCEANRCAIEVAERAVLGYHYGDVSARLLKAWNFPTVFIEMAACQFRPGEAPADVVPLLSHILAAKHIGLAMGPGVNADGYLSAVPGEFLLEWGFTSEILEATMAATADRAAARLGEKLTHGAMPI
jgi:HD-like signal output (HDOD) protein